MEQDELEWRRKRRKRRRRRRRRNALQGLMSLVMVILCLIAGVFAIKFYTHAPASDQITRLPIRALLRVSAASLTVEQETQTQTPVSGADLSVETDPDSIIYLTFDDGPSSQVTPAVLDVLERNGIQATFFIMDYSKDMLPIIQRTLNDGNTIGIHGKSHDYGKCYTEENAYLDGVEEVRQKLYEDTGYHAFCIRFPGGSSNTISAHFNEGIMTRLVEKVDTSDLEYFDWNVDSQDATGNDIPPETLAANVTDNLARGRGNVVLMHDASSKITTAEALQAIIDYGVANGYSFKAITEDTPPVHHRVFN